MTQKEIDSHLKDILPRIEQTAKSMCIKYQRSYDWQELISIAYIYVVKVQKRIEDKDMLRRWMTAKICQEIALTNSQTNLNIQMNAREIIPDLNPDINEENFDPYEDAIKAIEEYRQEPDRIKRIIFETYFDKQINTCRAMAKYFNVSTLTASKLIREMKSDLQEIELKQ